MDLQEVKTHLSSVLTQTSKTHNPSGGYQKFVSIQVLREEPAFIDFFGILPLVLEYSSGWSVVDGLLLRVYGEVGKLGGWGASVTKVRKVSELRPAGPTYALEVYFTVTEVPDLEGGV